MVSDVEEFGAGEEAFVEEGGQWWFDIERVGSSQAY